MRPEPAAVVGPEHRQYDVAPGNDRSLLIRELDDQEGEGAQLILVQNFFEELREVVPE